MLREIDLNKKQTDSDFIKSLPSHPGKEFEIQKRLDKLRDIKRFKKITTTTTTITMTKEVEVEENFSLQACLRPKIEKNRLFLKHQILTIFLTHCLKSMICDKD